MSDTKKIAQNAAWLIGVTTLNKVLAFVSFYLASRLTNPHVMGTYFFGVSVTSIFVVFADLGMTPVVIRAIASEKPEAKSLLSIALRLKMLLTPLAIIASIAYGLLSGSDRETMAVIAIACLVMSADTIHLLLYGVLRGKQLLKPEALGMFVGQIFTTTAAVLAALSGFGAVGLAVALLFGSAWNVFWAVYQQRIQGVQLELLPWKAETVSQLIREAAPFGIAGIAVKLYSYFDTLMLNAYQGKEAVGNYAVAYKLTYALQFVPLAFSAALYPSLASAWSRKDHDALRRSFLGSLRFMALLGFPMAAGLSALAYRLLVLLYGNKYLGSVAALEVLPWVLLPIFMDFPVGSLLNATHRAHLKTAAMLATMVINIVLNIFLVPRFGPVGAAWSGVIGFWSLFLIGMALCAKDVGGMWPMFSLLFRATMAAVLSWSAWYLIGGMMPLIPAVVFGAAVALATAFGLHLLTRDDLQQFGAHLRDRFPTKTVLTTDPEIASPEDDIHAESEV